MRMQNSKEEKLRESCLKKTLRLLFRQSEGKIVKEQQVVVIFLKRAVKKKHK